MDMFLMYISSFLIIFAYVGYFVMIFIGNRDKVSKDNGFDVSKDILSCYNNINIILSKGYFSFYNIRRKVIKLASFCYEGRSLSAICLSLLEVGVSAIDNIKNKYIDMARKIISNVKILYLLPIVSILINGCTYSIGDVRFGMVFIVLFAFISYMMIDIKNQANEWVYNNINKVNGINKENCFRIGNFMNKILWLDKFILFGELLIIIRFIGILLEIF